MRKKILEKRMARLMAKKEKLAARSAASTDAAEVRAINEELEELNEEIAEVNEEISAVEAEEKEKQAARSNIPEGAHTEKRGGNPLASYMTAQGAAAEKREKEEPFSSAEYRMAFKDYVQRGTPIPADVVKRAGGDTGTTVTTELGAIIPTTIMNEFVKEVSKVYGQVYSKVRKLNIKGGVKFPVSKLKANFKWITETTVSDKQKAGNSDEFVEFSYNVGEIRVAESLLAQVVTLSLFESEIVRIMVEAYVETMDKVIISGTGAGQPLGITVDPRVLANTDHIIEFTAAQFADWTAWRKNLFAKIPLSKRGKGEFLFTSATVESNLLTMTDANNRPIFKEATELTLGETATAGRFYGREVTLVEPDVIADFETAASGDIVGIYWIPSDYVINTNMAFGMKRYFDENTNEWINKGLTIVDGKILDASGCYLIKKK